jgi:hypothetical protein
MRARLPPGGGEWRDFRGSDLPPGGFRNDD